MLDRLSTCNELSCCKALTMSTIPLPILLLSRNNLFNPRLLHITDYKYSPASLFSWLNRKSSSINDEILLNAFKIITDEDCKLLP